MTIIFRFWNRELTKWNLPLKQIENNNNNNLHGSLIENLVEPCLKLLYAAFIFLFGVKKYLSMTYWIRKL